MNFVGLAIKANEYWAIMAMIDSAHRRASKLVCSLLLEEVQKLDTEALKKLERMDFDFSETGAVSLAAFHVKDIDDEPAKTRVSWLGRVLDLDVD